MINIFLFVHTNYSNIHNYQSPQYLCLYVKRDSFKPQIFVILLEKVVILVISIESNLLVYARFSRYPLKKDKALHLFLTSDTKYYKNIETYQSIERMMVRCMHVK
jgi:hypothetical protein